MTRPTIILTLLLLALFGTTIASSGVAVVGDEDLVSRELRRRGGKRRGKGRNGTKTMKWKRSYRKFYGTMTLKTCRNMTSTSLPGTACEVKPYGDYMCLFGDMTCAATAAIATNRTWTHPSTKCTCSSGYWSCGAFNACDATVNPYIGEMVAKMKKMAGKRGNSTKTGKRGGGKRGRMGGKRGGKRSGRMSGGGKMGSKVPSSSMKKTMKKKKGGRKGMTRKSGGKMMKKSMTMKKSKSKKSMKMKKNSMKKSKTMMTGKTMKMKKSKTSKKKTMKKKMKSGSMSMMTGTSYRKSSSSSMKKKRSSGRSSSSSSGGGLRTRNPAGMMSM